MDFTEEQLCELGFRKMLAEEFIQGSYNIDVSKQQWEYQGIVLQVTANGDEPRYRIFDKISPDFTIGIKKYLQLKQILYFVSQGRTITELLIQRQDQMREVHERMTVLQKSKPFLEDYRYNDIGGSFFEVYSVSNYKIYMTYEKHSTSAFYYTLNDIADLEHAKDTVQTGIQSHSSISFWFLALESYVNSLVKLSCIRKHESFETYKKQDLHTRLGSLVKLLELDKKSFYQNNIVAKVNEFASFRNDLFHDRHFHEELEFRHTSFSPIPIFNCQVDIIQALLIILEVTSMLRYAIEGLDTMPSVILKNNDVAVWEKLDIAYKKILQPYFSSVLDKHNMRTRLNFVFEKPQEFYSTVFQKGDVRCSLRVDQEIEFEYWLANEVTNFGADYYNQHLNSYNLTPGAMILSKVDLNGH